MLAAFLLVPSQAFAQTVPGTTAVAASQVALLEAGSVENIEAMDFGSILEPNTPGTVVLAAQWGATCSPTGGLIRTGPCKAAHFAIYGKKNKRVFIRDNNSGVVTLTGPGGATMTVTDMTIGVSDMSSKQGAVGWGFGSWRIDSNSGIAEFYVGGTLHVAANQNPGTYSGVLLIQIQMN